MVPFLLAVLGCLTAACVNWMFARAGRTRVAIDDLFNENAIRGVLYDVDERSGCAWVAYQRDVLKPAADALERFAAGVNRDAGLISPPAFYSFRVVDRICGDTLISLRKDRRLDCAIKHGRAHGPAERSYNEYDRLVDRLRRRRENRCLRDRSH